MIVRTRDAALTLLALPGVIGALAFWQFVVAFEGDDYPRARELAVLVALGVVPAVLTGLWMRARRRPVFASLLFAGASALLAFAFALGLFFLYVFIVVAGD